MRWPQPRRVRTAAVTQRHLGPLAQRLVAVVLVAGFVVGVALAVPAAGLLRVAAAGPATPGPAAAPAPAASVLLDADGTPFARLFDQFRRPVEAERIAPVMKRATVAIEDRRFFSHPGVDPVGIGRALLSNATRGAPLSGQGASTITMQYVKNHRLYATADTEQQRDAAVADTLPRKLADTVAALRLEQTLDKQDILAGYLNTVYFGHGAYGVAAAARVYFDTTAAELTLPQAALLAGMVRAPTTFDPVTAPDAARDRRAVVLDAMVDTGAITPERAASARAGGLGVVRPLRDVASGCAAARPDAGFFCRYVLDHLDRLGIDRAQLRTGGYTVRTTLDPRANAAAAAAARDQAPVRSAPGIVNAAAIVEPGRSAHQVLALAANHRFGPDADAGQSARPLPSAPVPYGAGSVYKIFTAAAALEAGMGLDTVLPAPPRYTSTEFTDGAGPYTVTGDGGVSGSVTLQQALARSPNTSFLALLDRLGSVDPVVDVAYRLGLRRGLALPAGTGQTIGEAVRAQQRASFTLGPQPTIPLELANVAATIASGGVWCPPTPLVTVTDRTGSPVPLPEPACERAVAPQVAADLATGLSRDTVTGTAAAAADRAGWRRPTLAKTGTTQRHLSAAFVGATRQFAGAVMTWSDATPPRPVCDSDPPSSCSTGTLYGGTVPARTWFAAMAPLHDRLPTQPITPPVRAQPDS